MASTALGRSVTARPKTTGRRFGLKHETRTAWLFLLPEPDRVRGLLRLSRAARLLSELHELRPAAQLGQLGRPGQLPQLLQDALFWNALGITFKYVIINIAIQTVLALAIAVLMHRLTQSVVVRSIVLVPWLIPNAVLALLWMWMLDPSLGIVNHWLNAIGISSQGFLGSESQVIPTIAGMNIWRNMGYTALLLFGGLVMIPQELLRGGGAGRRERVAHVPHVTLPLLRPVLALVLVVTVIGSFQVFDTVQIATGGLGGGAPGGPGNSSRVLYLYIFQQAFEFNALGYASALAVALILLLVIVAAFQLKMLRAGESDLA